MAGLPSPLQCAVVSGRDPSHTPPHFTCFLPFAFAGYFRDIIGFRASGRKDT